MKKYNIYVWAFIALVFISFIGLMSYWYPVTSDEFFRWREPFSWLIFKKAYFAEVPRISIFFGLPVFALGKWLFVVLNALVQLANVLCLFYIIFARLPDVKDLKDMPYFMIIACMSIFFVCRPSEVMFWLSGALNYSWNILFFLLVLCFLRQVQAQKIIFKDNWVLKTCVFVLGFIVGMSNESLAPVALGFSICAALFLGYKKLKTPRALSFLIFGLVIGCLVFFAAPAHYNKMVTSSEVISRFSSFTLIQKIFYHLYHMDFILRSLFYYPAIIILGLIICSLDKDKRNFKEENFYLSLICLALAALLALMLAFAPAPPRAYYAASVMLILAFMFFIRYLIVIYKVDFSKWLCYIVLGISLFFVPRFIVPHYYLHIQEKARKLPETITIPLTGVKPYIVFKGPTENLTIVLMDPALMIPIGDKIYITEPTVPVNW